MKSPLMRISLVIVFALATLGGVSTASAGQSTCVRGCNEAFRKALHDCRGVTPRAERRRCEEKARKAHRQCLRGCRPA
jgi:hypothetical protein